MPWKGATPITLSEKQEQVLTEYAVGSHTPLHLKTRSQIVLKAAKGRTNNSIEREMDLDAKAVKLWRDRYSLKYEELKRTEAETPRKLRSAIKRVLSDNQRPGSPGTYTDVQRAAIIALACEDPAKRGLPFSHWTPGLLQREAVRQGIVQNISVRQVGRFLKRKVSAAS